jgi:hypothetical protein
MAQTFQEQLDQIFSPGKDWKHRSFRTILDPYSTEYSYTTMDEKIQIMRKIVKSETGLPTIIRKYKKHHLDQGRQDIVSSVEEALAILLENALQLDENNISRLPDDTIDRIFANSQKWRLRGDPYLWQELKDRTAKHFNRATMDFNQFIWDSFEELVGHAPIRGENYNVERYDEGGMSSGMVSSDFWLDTGFPLLKGRHDFFGK